MNEPQRESTAPTKIDEAASAACTRSGAFALLLSLALVVLTPSWIDEPRIAALKVYVSARFNLGSALESLDEDPVWQMYKVKNSEAESLSIRQLSGVEVQVDADQLSPSTTKPEPPQVAKKRDAGLTHRAPAPVTSLRASVDMGTGYWEAERLTDSLINLNDPNTITRTRQVSNYFNLSIARWINKRNALAYRNILANVGKPCATELEWRDKSPSFISALMYAYRAPEFVPPLTRQALLNCLTLRDVRELAKLEPPTVTNPMELGGRLGPTIEIAPGSLPRGAISLMAATGALYVLLFFVVIYFSAFTREAVSSIAFPASGTVFGAFCKARSTLLVLFLAMWIPLCASVVLAFISRKWLFTACAIFVGGAILSVHRTLASKSYFAPLKSLLVLKKRRHTLSARSEVHQEPPPR